MWIQMKLMVSCHRGFLYLKFHMQKTLTLIVYPVFAVGALHSVALPHQKSSNSLKHENRVIITTTTWENKLPTSLTQYPIKKKLYLLANITFSVKTDQGHWNLILTILFQFLRTVSHYPSRWFCVNTTYSSWYAGGKNYCKVLWKQSEKSICLSSYIILDYSYVE